MSTSVPEFGNFEVVETKRARVEPRTYANVRRSDAGKKTKGRSNDGNSNKRVSDRYVGPPICILDNGAHTAKVGMSNLESPVVVPNCIMKVKSERKRFFIGNQIDDCRDLSGLYYLLPSEKGYVTKWTVQKPVWDYIFSSVCPIEDSQIVMTQPPFNFKPIQEITDEIFFEEYEVKAMYRVNPTDLAHSHYINDVIGKDVPCIIVDSGFSFTNVIPYIDGKKYYKGCKRINVGGKLLTNYLKDIISYRQLHVMDETYVINQVKEDACYVSLDFKADMKTAASHDNKNTVVRNYVLPDFNTIRRGYLQQSDGEEPSQEIAEGCQILRLNNERFTVPEILFHPSDIQMESMGVAEAIVKCIQSCPVNVQSSLAKHVVVVGGNANFPGFKERLYADVRSYLPDHWIVGVYKPINPTTYAWMGGKSLCKDAKIKDLLVTKDQYEENGSSYTYEKFSDWLQALKSADGDKDKTTESAVAPESILSSGTFTRLDLFGKYDKAESSESSSKDQDKDESDENNSHDTDKDKLEVEKDGNVVSVCDTDAVDANKNFNKSLPKAVECCEGEEEGGVVAVNDGGLSSYDFNLLDSGYV